MRRWHKQPLFDCVECSINLHSCSRIWNTPLGTILQPRDLLLQAVAIQEVTTRKDGFRPKTCSWLVQQKDLYDLPIWVYITQQFNGKNNTASLAATRKGILPLQPHRVCDLNMLQERDNGTFLFWGYVHFRPNETWVSCQCHITPHLQVNIRSSSRTWKGWRGSRVLSSQIAVSVQLEQHRSSERCPTDYRVIHPSI